MTVTQFSPGTAEKLRHYVYWLRDPRDGAVFYVGKGEGNRVFHHVKCLEADAADDEETEKEQRIRAITSAGLAVQHHIVRHNLNEDEALLLEAVLIDALPSLGIPLTNLMEGHGTGKHGLASPEELEALYAAKELLIPDGLNVIFINVNVQFRKAGEDLLEHAQAAWKINLDNARKVNMVVVHAGGLVRGCYVPDMDAWRKLREQFPSDKLKQYQPEPGCMPWIPARKKYFPRLDKDLPDRLGFLGKDADPAEAGEYYLRAVPERYTQSKGAPILYYKG